MAREFRTGLAAAAIVMLLGASPLLAQAPQKELSEKSVTTIMNYAWTVLPSKFTMPSGKVVEVDKTKRDALVPVETGREVIKVGYNSAQAQLCEMWEEQVANYDAMMARERAKKTWTEGQLLYITTLHRMTIHMAAGKLRVVEKGKDEVQVILETIEPTKDTCNDEKRTRVKETIAALVKAAPQVAPAQPGAAPAPQPIPAVAKDQKK